MQTTQTPKTILTVGGRILQMPYFSANGRILLMYTSGFLNSCSVGLKTGASAGISNSNSSFLLIENDE